MSTPEITVVIPVWNRDKELRESVASVQAQGQPHRILLVNNASDTPLPQFDGVEELVLTERVTIGEARNAGLAQVETTYVFFMDADDIMLPGALTHVHTLITSQPGAVLAASALYDWNPLTNKKKVAPLPKAYAVRIQRWQWLLRVINTIRYTSLVVGSALIRSTAAQAAGGFPGRNYGEDWVFSVALSFQGKVVLNRTPIKLYRIDPTATTLASGVDTLPAKFRLAMQDVRSKIRTAPKAPLSLKLMLPIIYLLQHAFYVKKMRNRRRSV